MKKLEGRALICLALVAVLLVGLCFFVGKLAFNGEKWATFYANSHIYTGGRLNVGVITDRNGVKLLENTEKGTIYSDDKVTRKATLHVVGDKDYNIATAANYAFRGELVGYNFVTGTNSLLMGHVGRKINLTIDSELNKTAYEALAGRNGFVGVYNWKTGEIMCMVSSPSFDPENASQSDTQTSGVYINKVISSTFTPGSIFKLVTTAAALENTEDLDNWTYKCTGSCLIDGEKITCPKVHGTMDIYGALANSCNCAYANLAVDLDGTTLAEYVEKLGLTKSYSVNGIQSAKGKFNFDSYNINIGWAGIGQFEDQVNPLSMMVYMGAIAGDGNAAVPVLLKGSKTSTVNLLSGGTAREIGDMMRNNVKVNYGDSNYLGLELHAKSGTAEVDGKSPHAWFTGYSGEYAFIVCVENGGYGSSVAGPIANKVLQKLKTEE